MSPEARTVRRLRTALLIALVVALSVLAALWFFGRPPKRATVAERLAADDPAGAVGFKTSGQGFERTFSEGDRPVFAIRGDSYTVDQNDVVLLQGVVLSLFRDNGDRFDVASQQARYLEQEKEALLLGAVHLTGPGGLELRTEKLSLGHGGRRLVADLPVSFNLTDAYQGTSESMDVDLTHRIFRFHGPVALDSGPGAEFPVSIRAADRVVFEQDRQQLRAEGDASIRHGGDVIAAERISTFFSEDGKLLRFLRARWEVSARLAAGSALPAELSPGSGTALETTEITGTDAEFLFAEDGSGLARVNLEGTEKPATLTTAPRAGVARRLSAAHMVTTFAGGRPVELVAEPAVTLEAVVEASGGKAADPLGIDRARSERAVARFGAGGELAGVTLEKNVEVEGKGFTAKGDRVVFDAATGVADFTGDPAHAETSRGEVDAPRILYTPRQGTVQSSGGVRARLAEGGGAGAFADSPLAGSGSGPIWVEAGEGEFHEANRTFLFKNRVRAWRGDNVIVADELRGDETRGRLVATGRVRTRFLPESAPESGRAGGGGPIEARAESMTYDRGQRSLRYEKDVLAVEENRSLACDQMDVALDEAGAVETLLCTGNARIDDAAQGRKLAGHRALYRPAAKTIEVSGGDSAPKVVLTDQKGNKIESPRMLYEIDQNRVRMLGRDEPAAPPASSPP